MRTEGPIHVERNRGRMMMAQRKQVKPRKCSKCQQWIETDAKGIKLHAEECRKAGG
jgi:hypothetical protein